MSDATAWVIGERGKGAATLTDAMALIHFDEGAIAAGATMLVAGSAVFRGGAERYEANISALRSGARG